MLITFFYGKNGNPYDYLDSFTNVHSIDVESFGGTERSCMTKLVEQAVATAETIKQSKKTKSRITLDLYTDDHNWIKKMQKSLSSKIKDVKFETVIQDNANLNKKFLASQNIIPTPSREMVKFYQSKGINIHDYYHKDKYSIKYILTSSSTCLGGTTANCYSSDKFEIEGDEIPTFTQFYSMMEKINTNMPFSVYKTIESSCISEEIETKNDYYGGSLDYHSYHCDLFKLFSILKENEQI